MANRSIRDQMQMSPNMQQRMSSAPVRPQIQAPAAPGGAPARVVPQVMAQPAPTMATVAQGMRGINAAPLQPRVGVPVQQAPVGVAPTQVAAPPVRPIVGLQR